MLAKQIFGVSDIWRHFNIIIADCGPKIIDWPQAVEVSHPHAQEWLERDLSNVLRFFLRKYGIEMPLSEALSLVEESADAEKVAGKEAVGLVEKGAEGAGEKETEGVADKRAEGVGEMEAKRF